MKLFKHIGKMKSLMLDDRFQFLEDKKVLSDSCVETADQVVYTLTFNKGFALFSTQRGKEIGNNKFRCPKKLG